jgi:hypothetical protein
MSRPQYPQLVVQLAGQQAASSAGAGAWLQLSPDTMHQYRLHSQQSMLVGTHQGSGSVDVCLWSAACPAHTLIQGQRPARHEPCFPLCTQVGLCHPPELLAGAGAGAALSSPARPRSPYPASSSSSFASPGGMTPSKFAPSTVVLAPDHVELVDLWHRAGLVQDNSSQGVGLRRCANSAACQQQHVEDGILRLGAGCCSAQVTMKTTEDIDTGCTRVMCAVRLLLSQVCSCQAAMCCPCACGRVPSWVVVWPSSAAASGQHWCSQSRGCSWPCTACSPHLTQVGCSTLNICPAFYICMLFARCVFAQPACACLETVGWL